MIVDSHAHLYLDQFDTDRPEVIEAATSVGVQHIYLPNIDSTTIDAVNKLSDSYPDICHPMMGLHPCSVGENFPEELEKIQDALRSRPYAAVGEIGIDLYWDKSFRQQQIASFLTQCEWANELNLPIVIHSRESIDLILEILEPLDLPLTGIFHCFTGSLEQAERIIRLGFLLGIGGVVTFKNSKLPSVLDKINLAHVVVETDAPYLTPHPHRGKRNESKFITLVVDKLSEIYGISALEVSAQTTQNALQLFNTQ